LQQLEAIEEQTNKMGRGFERAVEAAIVGSAESIKGITKQFQSFNTRLLGKHPPKSFTVRSKDMPQLPKFQVNLSRAK